MRTVLLWQHTIFLKNSNCLLKFFNVKTSLDTFLYCLYKPMRILDCVHIFYPKICLNISSLFLAV